MRRFCQYRYAYEDTHMSLYKFVKSTSRLVVVSGASLVIATDCSVCIGFSAEIDAVGSGVTC